MEDLPGYARDRRAVRGLRIRLRGIDTNLLYTTVGVVLIILLLIYASPYSFPVLISEVWHRVGAAVVYCSLTPAVLTVRRQ